MADEITPADAPPPTGGGGGNWIKEHKGTAAGIAVVLIVGLLYVMRKKAASSSSSTSGSLGTSTGPAVYEIAPGYTSGSQGAYGSTQDYSSQIAALTQAVNSLGAVSPAAPGSGSATAGSVNANASSTTPMTASAQGTLLSPSQALADLQSGATEYQMGSTAIAYDQAHNISPTGINANELYPLSQTAATNLANSGQPVYL